MQSLADFLGVEDPRPEADRPAADHEQILDISNPSDFCKRILETREFRQYIMNGIVLGDIPPAIMLRVMDHALGKPVERVQVQTIQNLDGLSPEELRAYLQERIESLATMVHLLEESDETVH